MNPIIQNYIETEEEARLGHLNTREAVEGCDVDIPG